MGRVVIVAYMPREGREAELLDALRDHVPILRAEGLVTDLEPVFLRARDGTYLEIFEWASAEAIQAAHSNAAVQELWQRFAEASEYRSLASLSEANDMFAEFEPVKL
jgi:quinol monooxygenase YgiN